MPFVKIKKRFTLVEHREEINTPIYYSIEDTENNKEIGLPPNIRTDYTLARAFLQKLNQEEL